MNLVMLTPGAGGMYCGNCLRDNALTAALRRQGHDALMLPLYLPMTLDEPSAATPAPMFFGGVNVYLAQNFSWHRRAPAWLRRWFDAPWILKWASGKAAKTRASDVGELNHSMLLGEEGRQARELEELIAWLRQQPKPDAVLLSNALLAGFTRRLKAALGVKVIVCLQGEEAFLDALTEPWRERSWDALARRGAEVDGWISPSRFFAQRMSERLALPRGRVHVAHNGIQLQGYERLAPRVARPAGQPLAVGFFARMCHEKGLDLAVDAFIELRRRGALGPLRLRIGGGCGPGDEPFVAQQKGKLEAAGLLADAEFFPNVTRDEKIAFFAGCDVVTVPARQTEAFGLYLIESMAAGAPLAQPRFAAFPELIDATGGGVITEDARPGTLADGLEGLLANRERLAEISNRGRRAVFDQFSDDAMARRVADSVRSVLGQPPAPLESKAAAMA